MSDPDWEALREIGREMHALIAANRWDRSAYNRLIRKAKIAANGNDYLLEFLVNKEP